jgi:hypothetical protein
MSWRPPPGRIGGAMASARTARGPTEDYRRDDREGAPLTVSGTREASRRLGADWATFGAAAPSSWLTRGSSRFAVAPPQNCLSPSIARDSPRVKAKRPCAAGCITAVAR